MKNHSRFDCGRLSKIFDCKISVKTIFKMNSLYLISLTVLVVMISYVNTTNTPVENSQVSGKNNNYLKFFFLILTTVHCIFFSFIYLYF